MQRTLCILAFLLGAAPSAKAQLWREFVHPDDPYQGLTNPSVEITIPELVENETTIVILPVLVVLLDYNDLGADTAQHDAAFYADMVFGTGTSGPWTATRPSVKQELEASTNGRLVIVAASSTDTFGAADGVVGWVTAQCPPGESGSCGYAYYTADIHKKRAEGIRRADPFFDYQAYDDGDGVLTSDELAIVVINAEDGCCDQHPGHSSPTDCVGCAGGNVRRTTPNLVLVEGIPPDGLYVHQHVAGIIEGAHAHVIAHELCHQVFGLGDLYANMPTAFNPHVQVADGFVEIPRISCGSGCKKAANDACVDAVCLADGDVVQGTTVNSTGSDVSSCASSDAVDVWFTYTPTVSEDVALDLCIPGCSANTDMMDSTLSVFDACGGNEVPGWCNDDVDCDGDGVLDLPCDRASRLVVTMQAGTTYYVRVSGWGGATGRYRLKVTGGGGLPCPRDPSHFRPPPPDRASLMAAYPPDELVHLDPWAKLHLGFTKPVVVTHDGTYTLHAAEPLRNFAQQDTEPEALVIFDPLRPEPYKEYFLVENRDIVKWDTGSLVDRGLAVWVIDERPLPGESQPDLRRVVRLVRRSGHHTPVTEMLWDGVDGVQGYDFTPTSTPRDSSWSDGTTSWVELTDVSPAGSVMTVHVQLTPLFVDGSSVTPAPQGTSADPWLSVADAVTAVAGQDLDGDGFQDGPRTLRLQAGSYAETLVVGAPCTLTAAGGSAVIGE